LQGRREATQDTCSHTHEKREKQQTRVNRGVQGVRCSVARKERDKGPHRKWGEQHSERSTSKGEQHAVGEKLTADPAT